MSDFLFPLCVVLEHFRPTVRRSRISDTSTKWLLFCFPLNITFKVLRYRVAEGEQTGFYVRLMAIGHVVPLWVEFVYIDA